ncbi:hypothetical protein CMV24_10895 [Pseudomonas plecoglossicida]|uniref:Uncharacterized protein n=1 Tax=Pseudomonas plecoglossicida TaxID=70775 RepID=A0A2A3M685_PSEDL|nr:hypothetical protein CMV24_10895 [Pseudomonas plecoglossicida]
MRLATILWERACPRRGPRRRWKCLINSRQFFKLRIFFTPAGSSVVGAPGVGCLFAGVLPKFAGVLEPTLGWILARGIMYVRGAM